MIEAAGKGKSLEMELFRAKINSVRENVLFV
jgi:hypothetical protein